MMRIMKKVGVSFEQAHKDFKNNKSVNTEDIEVNSSLIDQRKNTNMNEKGHEQILNKNGHLLTFFRVPIPEINESTNALYKKLFETYDFNDAASMLLKDALESWCVSYTEDSKLYNKAEYPFKEYFRTSRKFDALLFENIRNRLDPMSRRSQGWVAGRIAISAISEQLKKPI